MRNREKELEPPRKDTEKETEEVDIFSMEEIIVEEIAIDGICGVY